MLAGFFQRLAGNPAGLLKLAVWSPPSAAEIRGAAPHFADLAEIVPALPAPIPGPPGPAVCELGSGFLRRLGTSAAHSGVTAAAAVTWAWGQAVARATDCATALVEQVRCGPPLPGTAGFTMHTLPVAIPRSQSNWENVRQLRVRLLEMRQFETVTASDFPYGGFPHMSDPAISVIMVERGTLEWQLGAAALAGVEHLRLHESDSQALLATAHLAPALQLAVEGPGKHALLAAWTAALREIVNP